MPLGTPNDTTTTLSPAAAPGGDVMDETLVTQSDGHTEAKRERVVPTFDDGTIMGAGQPGNAIPVYMRNSNQLLACLVEIRDLLSDIKERL